MNKELTRAIEVCQGYEVVEQSEFDRLCEVENTYDTLKADINALYESYRYEPQAFEQAFSTFIYNVLGKVV